jgi:hypothetical protein
MIPSFRVVATSALAVVLVAGAAGASRAATAAQKCVAGKLDATARAVAAHVSCEARALERSKPVRAGCHEAADARLAAAFARLEARGACPFVDDAGAVDAALDGVLAALLETQATGRCGAIKLRLAGKKAFTALACRRVGVRRGEPPAPACLAKATARFLAAFARADKKAGCKATGDAAAVGAIVDQFVTETAGRIIDGAAPATPSPTATATPSPDPAPANLAAAVDGDHVALTWTPPGAGSGNTHVRLLRRLDDAPTDPEDAAAALVFFGTAAQASDPLSELLPTTSVTARTYHYAAFGCTAGGVCESTGSRTTLAPTLVEVLRAGGYVLYWRHAAADVCQDDLGLGTAATTTSPDWWKSCDANCGTATARQLNATGVMQATTIGSELDRLGIPIGRVASSEFCRNVTTAELMDLGPTVELRQDITYFVYDEAGRCAASYALIEELPAAGTNTAIVGHAGFSPTCPVLGALAWGEAAIFKPDGAGGETLVARVLADDWAGF